MHEKRPIEFTIDGLNVPYRCADGAEIDVIVDYGFACSSDVVVRGTPSKKLPKEVFGTILRALYGEEPRFENPAPPILVVEKPAAEATPVSDETVEKPPILDASELPSTGDEDE